MAGILIVSRVEDLATWMKVFEGNESLHRNLGIKATGVWHAADYPNSIFVLLEHDDLDTIKQFSASADFKQALKRAGAKGVPTMQCLEDIRRYDITHGTAA